MKKSKPLPRLVKPFWQRRPLKSFCSTAPSAMVSTAHPEASSAGCEILRRGGNAVDAFTTVSFVLSVVAPHHTGIGGGGFALVKMGEGISVYDFRERAPLAARRDMYLEGGTLDLESSMTGPKSVATPGFIAGVLQIQSLYGSGKFGLGELIAPAIRLAEKGFGASPYFVFNLERRLDAIRRDPEASKIFLSHGKTPKPGTRIIQKDLAQTLRQIAEGESFYEGVIARRIVESIRNGGGCLSLEDLKRYEVRRCEPVETTHHGFHLFSMPPPSAGGVGLSQMLNIFERFPETLPQSGESFHRIAEATRIAHAHAASFIGDPLFADVPVDRLVSKSYGETLRIGEKAAQSETLKLSIGLPLRDSTSHLSIVDQEGNAVSSTQTINLGFGSCFVVPGTGILMNDEMADFSVQPGSKNAVSLVGSEANAIAPQKTPMSCMTPCLVFDPEGRLFAVIGGSGGSRIITSVFQCLINLIDFRMTPLDAVAAARIHHQWMPDTLFYEDGSLSSDAKEDLEKRGHTLTWRKELGRVHLVCRSGEGWAGVADPRDEGKACGF